MTLLRPHFLVGLRFHKEEVTGQERCFSGTLQEETVYRLLHLSFFNWCLLWSTFLLLQIKLLLKHCFHYEGAAFI